MDQVPIDTSEIVVTAARSAEEEDRTPASATIIDARRVDRMGESLVPALLRLAPSVAVATSGPAGSLAEVRIRGAENNHTLLFIDGIRANDPATGNQPRFELLNADLASRIEIVRGPQSALWGSEAIGGIVAVDTDPSEAATFSVSGEAGSFAFRRAAVSTGVEAETASASLGLAWQRAAGIDSFDRRGERDGYRNLSGRASARWSVRPSVELGASGFALTGRSEFDGYVGFARGDTLDNSRNALAAGRLWARVGATGAPWRGTIATTLLESVNRNLLDDQEINRTRGTRWTASAQLERGFATGIIEHTLIAALEHDDERFAACDTVYFGATNQRRARHHQALTLEWRGETDRFVADVAVRRDVFNRFKDASTLRLSGLARLGAGLSLAASYGEGIAQPTFFDLYGFFPDSFLGNPSLVPESSRGIEASLRFARGSFRAAATAFRQRLHKEIVDVFDPASGRFTTVNRNSDSRRSGVEIELGWAASDFLRLTGHYAFLDAAEPASAGGVSVREPRRPRHSGSVAADGERGPLSYGFSLAFTGPRRDVNFDLFPAEEVRLRSYWLAAARVAYRVRSNMELFARAANALDADYQDAVGYRTEGRSFYAGLRLAAGR